MDADVMRAIADALDGRWSPDEESDDTRRRLLVTAARLRLYADRDLCGWALVTYHNARQAAFSRGGSEWTVGFVGSVENLEDAPREEEVRALARIHGEAGIAAESAVALAWAVLTESVDLLVTAEPRSYRHSREMDLPERLKIVTPERALELLRLRPGELPRVPLPPGSRWSDPDGWWIPR